ncbi:hypothetical protein KCU93_g109, partial [Aureobasidium melanogenum]
MFAALELERYVKATSVSSDVHLPNVSSDKELAVKVVCTRRIMALTRIELTKTSTQLRRVTRGKSTAQDEQSMRCSGWAADNKSQHFPISKGQGCSTLCQGTTVTTCDARCVVASVEMVP